MARVSGAALVITLLFAAQISLAGDAPAPDQEQKPSNPSDSDQTHSEPAKTDQSQICVDVEIGGDRSAYFKCLNEQMQRGAEREHQVPQPTAPIDTHSPSNQLGTANDAAAREKMGNSFGKSAVPQRPASTFVNPLVPGSH